HDDGFKAHHLDIEMAKGSESGHTNDSGHSLAITLHDLAPNSLARKERMMERRLVLGATIGSSSLRGGPSIAMPSAFLRTSSTRLDQPLPKASHVDSPRRKAMRLSQTALTTVIG